MDTDKRAECACCGTSTPIDLLDAKPNDPRRPDSCDWEVFECFQCYGPGWKPANRYQSHMEPTRFVKLYLWVRMKYRHWYFSDPERKRIAMAG